MWSSLSSSTITASAAIARCSPYLALKSPKDIFSIRASSISSSNLALVGKKRMIHDATHGVRVNQRIRCRDKIRAPGAREKKQLLREMMEAREVAFSVVGDIAKGHRTFKHREEEHGYLGCQIDANTDGLRQQGGHLRCLLR